MAIALVLEGASRAEAARQTGRARQTLRNWVDRFNDTGVEGLISRKSRGATPKLTAEQVCELRQLVIDGSDPAVHKVMRWRCVDLRAEVIRRFSVTVDEITVGRWLRKLRLIRLQSRPHHPKKDPQAQEAFKKFGVRLKETLLGQTSATPVEIWFRNEARVGQKGSLSYIWAPVGSRPAMVRDNRRNNAYIFGAICPERGISAAVITPATNIECMNLHLAEISTQVRPGSVAAIIRDGASGHAEGGELKVLDNIVLLPLPPYAPELNPMENIWEYLRANKLSGYV